MNTNRRVVAESVAAGVFGYLVAGVVEAALIGSIRPTELQLAWVSDVVLAVAFGVAVYMWRHLLSTRRELAARERAELVLETQLSVAADIQSRLLPPVPCADNGFQWAAALRSAGKIGGDFYDFVEHTSGVWLVLVADVSGKGIPAAMALGSLRAAFRAVARDSADPARVLARLSEVLYEQWLGSPYVSAMVLACDPQARTLAYANAGHPSGLLVGRNGTRYLSRGGPPAGLFPRTRFEEECLSLCPGDVCVLVSDGVTEALEGEAPLERTVEAMRSLSRPVSAGKVCETVMKRALAGRGPLDVEQWEDDRTVVVLTVSH